MKTYEEILEILKQYFSDENEEDYSNGISRFAHADFDSSEMGLGPITHIGEADSGGSDQGSDWQRVYHFEDHDVYIKVSGYYQSHHGTDFDEGWDSCSEVRPTSKTITVYQ